MRGGTLSATITDATTHIILDPASLSRLPAIRAVLRRRPRQCHVVSLEWVHASIARGVQVEEAAYRL